MTCGVVVTGAAVAEAGRAGEGVGLVVGGLAVVVREAGEGLPGRGSEGPLLPQPATTSSMMQPLTTTHLMVRRVSRSPAVCACELALWR